MILIDGEIVEIVGLGAIDEGRSRQNLSFVFGPLLFGLVANLLKQRVVPF